MAAAIGAGLPITEAAGNMIVDIGGGTTDIAVISLAGIVYSKSVRIAGNAMDDAIAQYVKREHDLLIGERTAERIKIELGSASPLVKRKEMEVKGRHVLEGKPCTVLLNDNEIREALAEPVRMMVQAVRDALERIPPRASADVCDRGIVLSGGVRCCRTSTNVCATRPVCRCRSPRIRSRPSCSAPARCCRTSISCGRSRSSSHAPHTHCGGGWMVGSGVLPDPAGRCRSNG